MTPAPVSPRRHPLIGLTADEIKKAASLCQRWVYGQTQNPELEVHFKHITLDEPPKALLLPYLDAEDAGVPVHERPFVPRAAQIIYCEPGKSQPFVAIVSLDTGAVVGDAETGKGQHAPLDRCGAPQPLCLLY